VTRFASSTGATTRDAGLWAVAREAKFRQKDKQNATRNRGFI
jgi:hypothetical protein